MAFSMYSCAAEFNIKVSLVWDDQWRKNGGKNDHVVVWVGLTWGLLGSMEDTSL